MVRTADAADAFLRVKTAAVDATLLAHPIPNSPLALFVDASAVCAAVHEVTDTGHFQPLGFFSKTLQLSEQRYSTFGRELLAAYLAIKHFRHVLEGRSLTVFMDHKPYAVTLSATNHSPRQLRQLAFIAEFPTDIRHVSGADNTVADTLSRNPLAALT